MAAVLRVDTAALREAGPAIHALSASVDTSLERLSSALDAEGACWGSDEMGAAFAREYTAASRQVREAFTVLRDNVEEVGECVLGVADDADAADGRAQSRLD